MPRRTNNTDKKKKKKKDKGILEQEIFRMMQAMAKSAIEAALDEILKL
ncbi:MAG: hypothetical protein IKE28_02245 [Solobacterium sp.]|nr:hypothetical protein [Solobacterium sp.]